MMERVDFSELAIYDRIREISHHFHLPLDADFPEG